MAEIECNEWKEGQITLTDYATGESITVHTNNIARYTNDRTLVVLNEKEPNGDNKRLLVKQSCGAISTLLKPS